MTYGHRSRYRADALADRFVRLPTDLEPVLGIYAAHMGPICANGLLHRRRPPRQRCAQPRRRRAGRRVAVMGAGVVGLMTGLLASTTAPPRSSSWMPPARRRVAERLGLQTLGIEDADPAVILKTRWRHAGDRGADVVFQCRGQASALATALRILRPQGTVIDLAFYPGGCDEVRLGEEFHHNGLSVRCAVGRVPRGTGHLGPRPSHDRNPRTPQRPRRRHRRASDNGLCPTRRRAQGAHRASPDTAPGPATGLYLPMTS